MPLLDPIIYPGAPPAPPGKWTLALSGRWCRRGFHHVRLGAIARHAEGRGVECLKCVKRAADTQAAHREAA